MFAEVASQNVVGYTTVTTVKGQWKILGVQFENMKPEGVTFKLDEYVKGDFVAKELNDYGDEVGAPQIQIRNGNASIPYYYTTDPYGLYGDARETPAWMDEGGSVADTITIKAGQGIWFRDLDDNRTLSLAGQVISENTKSVTLGASWNLISNPFPVAMNLNGTSFDWSTLDCKELDDYGDELLAPQIQIRNGNASIPYYYTTDPYGLYGDARETPAWMDEGGTVVNISVDPGVGFWIKPNKECTITATK